MEFLFLPWGSISIPWQYITLRQGSILYLNRRNSVRRRHGTLNRFPGLHSRIDHSRKALTLHTGGP